GYRGESYLRACLCLGCVYGWVCWRFAQWDFSNFSRDIFCVVRESICYLCAWWLRQYPGRRRWRICLGCPRELRLAGVWSRASIDALFPCTYRVIDVPAHRAIWKARVPMSTRFIGWLVFAIALIATLTFTADNYVLRLATTVGMYAALAWSWNLIGGFAGYPSFATAAFFGLGA